MSKPSPSRSRMTHGSSDSPGFPERLDQILEGEEIGTVTPPSHGLHANHCRATDGVDNTRRCHTAILDRLTAEIQIRSALMNRFSACGHRRNQSRGLKSAGKAAVTPQT